MCRPHPKNRAVSVVIIALTSLGSAAASGQDRAPAAAAEPVAEPPPATTLPAVPPAELDPTGTIRDRSEHSRPLALSALAYVPWWYGVGIGGIAALELPVLPDGFIRSINDQVSIEPSFGIAYLSWRDEWYGSVSDTATLYRPAIAGVWSFHLSPRFRVFGALDIGYTHLSRSWEFDGDSYREKYGYFYTELSAGLAYKLAEHVALRTQLGWQGIKLGLTFL